MNTIHDDIDQADDVRAALRALTADLETPTTHLVAVGASLGAEKRRRRTIVRLVAPLAVAAVVAPMAFLATGHVSLPSRGTVTAGPQVTVLAPGSPVGPTFPVPAPEPDTTFGVKTQDGPTVLEGWVEHLLQRDVTTTDTGTLSQAGDDPSMPQALRDAINSGSTDSSRRYAVTLEDPGGNSLLVVDVDRPYGGSWEDRMAEDGCGSRCSVVDQGRLETSTDINGDGRSTTVHLLTREGWEVLVSSYNSDGILGMGGNVTRSAPLLDGVQLSQLAVWEGWLR